MRECEYERMWYLRILNVKKIMWNKKRRTWDYVKIITLIWESVNMSECEHKKCQYERIWIWNNVNIKMINVTMRECEHQNI